MDDPNLTVFLMGGGIGFGLMLLGSHALRRLQPAMPVRVGLGAAMFLAGLVALFHWPGIFAVFENPVQLGITLGLMCLGVNQLAAPLRRAMGKPV